MPERGSEDLRWFTRTSAPSGWTETTHERQREYQRRYQNMGKAGLGVPPQIQPFYAETPTEMADNPPATTKRRKRALRGQQVGYAFRHFAPVGQQVVSKYLKKW